MSDISGNWMCTNAENMDKFLEANGVAWMMRKTASGMGFGVGKQQYRISGGAPGSPEITIVDKDAMGNEKSVTVKTDGSEVMAPDGKGKMKATWDGASLVQTVVREDGQTIEKKHDLVGDSLQVTLTTKGVTAQRTYTRQ